MNMLAHIHDTNCDCYNPLEHTIVLILEQEKELKFKAPEKDLLRKCIGDAATAGEGADPDGFTEGDLEDLFKEDGGEENAG